MRTCSDRAAEAEREVVMELYSVTVAQEESSTPRWARNPKPRSLDVLVLSYGCNLAEYDAERFLHQETKEIWRAVDHHQVLFDEAGPCGLVVLWSDHAPDGCKGSLISLHEARCLAEGKSLMGCAHAEQCAPVEDSIASIREARDHIETQLGRAKELGWINGCRWALSVLDEALKSKEQDEA